MTGDVTIAPDASRRSPSASSRSAAARAARRSGCRPMTLPMSTGRRRAWRVLPRSLWLRQGRPRLHQPQARTRRHRWRGIARASSVWSTPRPRPSASSRSPSSEATLVTSARTPPAAHGRLTPPTYCSRRRDGSRCQADADRHARSAHDVDADRDDHRRDDRHRDHGRGRLQTLAVSPGRLFVGVTVNTAERSAPRS